jgi:hypothetical protein
MRRAKGNAIPKNKTKSNSSIIITCSHDKAAQVVCR